MNFPPVIGVYAAACLAITSCTPDPAGTAESEGIRLEGEVLARGQREELLRMRLARLSTPVEELAELIQQLELQRARVAALTERRTAMQQETDRLQTGKDALRREALRQARTRGTGRYLPELALANGRAYQKVTITAITEAGIQIRHESGTARLTSADLGARRSEDFGVDPGLAQATLAKEESHRRAYEQWVDQELAVKSLERKPLGPHIPPTPYLHLHDNSTRESSNPLRQKPRYFGGVRSSPRYRSYYYYRIYTPASSTSFFTNSTPSTSVLVPSAKTTECSNEASSNSIP